MGSEDLEDKATDIEYRIILHSLDVYHKAIEELQMYEQLYYVYTAWHRMRDDYETFYLRNFDTEGRKVIRDVYKVLGYNPYNPKQLRRGK